MTETMKKEPQKKEDPRSGDPADWPVAEPHEAGRRLIARLEEEAEDVRLVPWRGRRYYWAFLHAAIEKMQRTKGLRPMDIFMAAMGPLMLQTIGSARWLDMVEQAGETLTEDQRKMLRRLVSEAPRLSLTDLQIAACTMFETGVMSFYDVEEIGLHTLFKWADAGYVMRATQDLAFEVALERQAIEKEIARAPASNGKAEEKASPPS